MSTAVSLKDMPNEILLRIIPLLTVHEVMVIKEFLPELFTVVTDGPPSSFFDVNGAIDSEHPVKRRKTEIRALYPTSKGSLFHLKAKSVQSGRIVLVEIHALAELFVPGLFSRFRRVYQSVPCFLCFPIKPTRYYSRSLTSSLYLTSIDGLIDLGFEHILLEGENRIFLINHIVQQLLKSFKRNQLFFPYLERLNEATHGPDQLIDRRMSSNTPINY